MNKASYKTLGAVETRQLKNHALIEENCCYLQLNVAIWKQGLVLPDLPYIQICKSLFLFNVKFPIKKYCAGQTKSVALGSYTAILSFLTEILLSLSHSSHKKITFIKGNIYRGVG